MLYINHNCFSLFIGCRDKRLAPVLRDLIQTPNFRVVVVEDCEAVEVCGALKVCNYIYKFWY